LYETLKHRSLRNGIYRKTILEMGRLKNPAGEDPATAAAAGQLPVY
jgi:hypothetical protein